jgi:hypothetical protein
MSATESQIGSKPVITFFDAPGDTARAVETAPKSRPFSGTAHYADGSSAKLVVHMTAESRTGEIAGTILADSPSRGQHLYLFRGTARRGIFTLQALATGNRVAMLTGTITPDAKSVAGTFLATEPSHPASNGTFEVNRA